MRGPLTGRLILIAEDEPLIALDVKQTFEEEGAQVIVARTLNDALHEVEHPALSAAVLDYALGGSDSSEVCARMTGTENSIHRLYRIRQSRRGFPLRGACQEAGKPFGTGGNRPRFDRERAHSGSGC